MRQDERAPFVAALQEARARAYPAGEFVGQEGFMLAGEILDLARRAGARPGGRLVDLCCGIAGPGRHIVAELGCHYLGLDYSADAVDIARQRTRGLPCHFDVAHVPPLPPVRADVVLLLETMLAFEDKSALLQEISRILPVGGRFGFTLEEGKPLTSAEIRAMPDPDTVWLTPLPEIVRLLSDAGLRIGPWQRERTGAHAAVCDALLGAFTAGDPTIAARIGRRATDELLSAHRLWSRWLGARRVRKFAIVAERTA